VRAEVKDVGGVVFRPKQSRFMTVPYFPIPYWLSDEALESFASFPPVASLGYMGWGISSSNNDRFLRRYWEAQPSKRWLRHAKGGKYACWAGLEDHLVDWEFDGARLKRFILERYPYLKENYEIKLRPYTFGSYGWTYSSMSRGCLGVRFIEPDGTTNAKSPALFTKRAMPEVGAVLNSRIASYFLHAIAPALNIDEGYIGVLPLPPFRQPEPPHVIRMPHCRLAMCSQSATTQMRRDTRCPGFSAPLHRATAGSRWLAPWQGESGNRGAWPTII
jgi:hypothetical protein